MDDPYNNMKNWKGLLCSLQLSIDVCSTTQMETNELEKRDSSNQLSKHTGLIKYTFKMEESTLNGFNTQTVKRKHFFPTY